jgi:hypothetical protein
MSAEPQQKQKPAVSSQEAVAAARELTLALNSLDSQLTLTLSLSHTLSRSVCRQREIGQAQARARAAHAGADAAPGADGDQVLQMFATAVNFSEKERIEEKRREKAKK